MYAMLIVRELIIYEIMLTNSLRNINTLEYYEVKTSMISPKVPPVNRYAVNSKSFCMQP